jgi:Flp pilus assembly protein TadD
VLALGQVLIKRGNVDKAIAVYQARIQSDPNDPRFYFLVGSLEEGRGNQARAQQMYQKALDIDSNDALAANNLAYLMLESGQNVDMAVSLAQIARQGLPDIPNTADTLGWAYYHKAVYGLAVDLLEQAVGKAPENAGYHYHLGLAYAKNKEPFKARQQLQKALEIDPNFKHSQEIKQALQSMQG